MINGPSRGIRITATARCDVCEKEAPAVWQDDRWIIPQDGRWQNVRVEAGPTWLSLRAIREQVVCCDLCMRTALISWLRKLESAPNLT